ncbi:right-handed parallel beta-helix repeat-containing protein [uncultured Bacteroides sp.]|uniref:right-handed parallel beta-helix repeat-containing protein n=1 Tax=uncultured Bacteroides sp. TaxID=162156 RepID=UPI002AAB4C6F|nr:right-handed parallel beta-helix repeat-containing protein [uncultured Bacteroides sp.]
MKKSTFLIVCAFFVSLAVSATDVTTGITTNTTFTADKSPYVIVNNISVNNGVTLTIEPGVTVSFNSGRYLHVLGTLNANGATFTGNAGVTKGFWDGIYVSYEYYNEIGSVNLNNCTIEYASNLYVRKGQMTLNKCTLNNFSGSVRISDQGILNIDSTKISNTNFPITYYGDGVINSGKGIVFTDNAYNYVDIDFYSVTHDFHLKNFGYPYYNDNSIQVSETGTLRLDPGVNLQIAHTEIQIHGKLKAIGTKDNPIVFDKTPAASYWAGMNILNSSVDTACIMKNCIFKNAIYDYEYYAAMEIENASPVIDSCRFVGNAYNLLITGVSKPTISNCVFGPSTVANGEARNITMDLNANPEFTNDSIQFNDKEIRAIKIKSADVSGDARLKKISFIGLNNISYCLYDNSTVTDAASLVIDPGVVIKCRYPYSQITGNGTITGIGTVAEPIIFTSIADDTYGNPADSQNDGTQTIGTSTGGRIFLYSTALSKLENWKFNYAGYYSNNWAVYVKNSNIVNKCEIKNSYNAVWFTGNAQVTNNSFVNISQYPIGYSVSTGTPDLQGNTITNVGYTGIQLDGVEDDSPTLKKMNFAGYTNLPYILTHTVTINEGNVLTINPGVVIKSQQSWARAFLINGAVKAIGQKNDKIIFTSIKDDSAWGDTNNDGTGSVPGNSDWYGLEFTGTASDTENILRNCEIRYSGDTYYYQSPIAITDCHVLLDSVKINFSYQCGISILGSANPEIKDCEFYNINWEPINMDMFANPTFTGNNKLANVADIAIRLREGVVSGTVPVRSFAGYNPITYSWYDDALTVNDQLTIPAGLTFKGRGRWNISGKLNIQGTADKPVVFTTLEDDVYGNPKDSQQNGAGTTYNNGGYFIFYDAANDSSTIDHAIFRYSTTIPIQLNNASPTIKNCTFENFGRDGISLAGTSSPVINNCTFNNVSFPFTTSLLTYPSSATGNVISGTTGKAIHVNDETLTQDATLAKRNFAGITNIPYVFSHYTVGTAAKLTVEPGVVSKFQDYGYMNVQNGIIAIGGSTPDSVIVFTSDRDDFYGGDTYNNNDADLPWNYSWQGIYFYNEAIDDNCVLKNCIFKYASYPDSRGAVTLDNASPAIRNCRFDKGYHGIISNNASLPVISDCDFIETEPNRGYAVWNKTASNTVTATNCWFNSATGPKHTSNPSGTGERVSDNVTFTPFITQLAKAELGDVSLNGTINPYDASLILQHAVSNIILNSAQQKVADVSKNGSITAYDASMILQYNVGLIAVFMPSPNMMLRNAPESNLLTDIALAKIQPTQKSGQFTIPVLLTTADQIKSLDMKYSFNPEHIKLISINAGKLNPNITLAQTTLTDNGSLSLSMASAYDLALNQDTIYMIFQLKNPQIKESNFNLINAIANETPVVSSTSNIIIGSEVITGYETVNADKPINIWVDADNINVEYYTQQPVKDLNIRVLDVSGRTLALRNFKEIGLGKQVMQIPLSDLGNSQKGVYVIEVNVDSRNFTKKLVINW